MFIQMARKRKMVSSKSNNKYEDKANLTLAEVDEAKSFGLPLDDYIRFCQIIKNRLYDELKETVISNVRRDITPTIKQELRKDIYSEVEKNFNKNIRQNLEKEIKEKIKSEYPTDKEIKIYRNYAREIEFDCLTQAQSASESSEIYSSRIKFIKNIFYPLGYLLGFSILPLYFCFLNKKSLNEIILSFIFYVMLVGIYFIAVINKHSRNETSFYHFRKITRDYLNIVDCIKKFRLVDVYKYATKHDLDEALQKIENDKFQIDLRFHPSIKSLTKARVAVRDQILTEMDPEKLLENFDEDTEEQYNSLNLTNEK